MEKMFIYVLDQAVTVSVVILAVILARLVLRRAPRWIVCALWAAVAIRLLVPVSIESPFSLVPDVQLVQDSYRSSICAEFWQFGRKRSCRQNARGDDLA